MVDHPLGEMDGLAVMSGLWRHGVGFGIGTVLLLGQPGWAQASPVLSFELPAIAGQAGGQAPVQPRVQVKTQSELQAAVQAAAQAKGQAVASPLLSFAPPRDRAEQLYLDASTTASSSFSSEDSSLPAFQLLFSGGSDSIVARAVGSAEGTRTPQGAFTWAYYGHPDPGNGKWNLGSFSYQHGADSPADADQRQLSRLMKQSQVLHQLAVQRGLELSITEVVNGIDLANQAPLAALDRGYIDWLVEARQLELSEEEGVLHARTWSYWDPDLERWNAPGLGNQWWSISKDQRRRQQAIREVLQQTAEVSPHLAPTVD